MSSAAVQNQSDAFDLIDLEVISENPLNPRRAFNSAKHKELTDSIREKGIVQPVLVRPVADRLAPHGTRYELVCGHRRVRAARDAGLATVPAMIRALSDTDVIEIAVVENCQRDDIHPLEEGDAYVELHEKHGRSVDEIAAKVGKSKATIYARMKISKVAGAVRNLILEGKIDPSVGLLIARIPNVKLQAEAARKLLDYARDREISYRWAAEEIQRSYMLRLAEAPFDPKDTDLVEAAGACVTCPKRTGAQPELFPDVKSADVCTDIVCFKAKRDAAWDAKKVEAKKAGLAIMSDKQATAQVFKWGSSQVAYDSELVDVDEKIYVGSTTTTYRALAKKQGKEPVLTLARDPQGNVRHLMSKSSAKGLVRAAAPEAKRAPVNEALRKENAKFEAKRALRDEVTERLTTHLVREVERQGPLDAWWKAIGQILFDGGGVSDGLLERRGIPNDDKALDAIEALLMKSGAKERAALLLEVAVSDYAGARQLDELVTAYGVDRKAIEAEAKTDLKAKTKADAAAKKAKGAAKKKGGGRG